MVPSIGRAVPASGIPCDSLVLHADAILSFSVRTSIEVFCFGFELLFGFLLVPTRM